MMDSDPLGPLKRFVAAPAPSLFRIGKYRAVREVGRGGMAVVYEAEDTALMRRVALKVLRDADAEAEMTLRLHREAAIAAQLRHPNIVGIHEVGMVEESGGRRIHFIAMEFVEGPTLAQVQEAGRADRSELLRILEDVASAVDFAHGKGVVHRDLKPANVLVEPSGRVVLTDFGLARAPLFQTQLTRDAAVMGTPHYMAPEQVRGEMARVGPRTDVYALGVMLYEVTTGAVPFQGPSVAAVYTQILNADPARPSPPVERELETIFRKAMEKQPERRYDTAGALADDLRRFRKGEPIHATPPSLLVRLQRSMARRRAVVVAGLIGVLGMAATAGLMVPRWLADRKAARDHDARLAAQERARPSLDAGRTILREGERLLGTPDWTKGELDALARRARAEFERALEACPGQPEALLEIARSYDMQGARADAVAFLTRTIQAAPQDPVAYMERALINLDSYEHFRHFDREKEHEGRKLRRSIEADLEAVRARSADRKELSLAEGMLRFADGRYRDAAEPLEEYTRLNENDPEGWLWLGHAWVHVPGSENRAIDPLGRAIRFRPRHHLAFFMRAGARLLIGESEAAIQDYTRVLEIDPRFAEAFVNIGHIRAKQGDPAAAIRQYDAALNIDPANLNARVGRASARGEAGDVEGAFQDFAEALRRSPKNANAYFNRGRLLAHQNRPQEARADFDRAVALDPCAKTFNVRGLLRRSQGDPAGALEDYSAAIEQDPRCADAYANRAGLHLQEGRLDAAAADIRMAMSLTPPTAPEYVWMKEDLERIERARADY